MDGDIDRGDVPAWLEMEERKARRQAMRLHASLSGPAFDDEPVELADVSTLGCRVLSSRQVTVGSYLTVTIPSFSQIEGWVAWSKPGSFGLDFSHPLRDEVVAHVLLL